jgi:hypothetical protein
MRLITVFALVGLIAGCDGGSTAPTSTPLVVEAYLFAGAPVEDVAISEVIPLGSTDTVGTPVADAEVVLSRGAKSYRLEPVGTSGRYHYVGTDLTVTAGDQFTLRVSRGDLVVTGETVVPAPPTSLTLDKTVLSVPNFSGGPPAGGGFTLDSIRVSWDNPSGDWFFLAIQSLDPDPEYILPSDIQGRFGGFRLRLSPTASTGQTITFQLLEVLGHHRATLYRVNKEYADLYQNRIQDSRDLNEPPTNLTGGLGIFSAFGGQSVDFTVQRQ